MKSLISRHNVLVIVLVLMLSQVMCNMPMGEEESIRLAEELLGLKIGEEFVYDTVIGEKQANECPEYDPPPQQLESYKFDNPMGEVNSRSTLTILTQEGEKEYGWRLAYDPPYCRLVSTSIVECVGFGEDGYTMKVFHIPSPGANMKLCYEAQHDVVLTEEDIPGNTGVQNGDAISEEGEQIEEQLSDHTVTLDECNGSKIVTITVGDAEKTKQGHCRYLVSYNSRSASKDVYIYQYKTHTNASTGLNHEWYRETALFAGNEHSEYQTIFASGEISTVDRVAIVFTSAACNWVGTDQDSLDHIAQELAIPCR